MIRITNIKRKNYWTAKMRSGKYKNNANLFRRLSEPQKSKYKFDALFLIIPMNI